MTNEVKLTPIGDIIIIYQYNFFNEVAPCCVIFLFSGGFISAITQFLGLSKTKYDSGVCLITDNGSSKDTQLILSERILREKHSGAWPASALKIIMTDLKYETLEIAENAAVHRPIVIESLKNKYFPFNEYLQKENLLFFTSENNNKIKFITHHLAHAYAAIAMSPFEKAIILVMDGIGSSKEEFNLKSDIGSIQFEECSAYIFNSGKVENIFQRWVSFNTQNPNSGDRVGVKYEKISEFIFNSPHASGKVMGLAPLGDRSKAQPLDWKRAFYGETKQEWESSYSDYFANTAAVIQHELEMDYEKILYYLRAKFPEYDNIILTGGCALNCTNNAKIMYSKIFSKIYVPAFPGDESISFGLANYLYFQKNPTKWIPITYENQTAYYGALSSLATDNDIVKVFQNSPFKIEKASLVIQRAAEFLNEGKIIAWFQGRSESGPRALGNRSILVRPDLKNIKEILNKKIKFRENFRPYGCSVLKPYARIYFDVDDHFESPFMSFAIQVRHEWKEKLAEVMHVDGTSRIQTVRVGQNKKFYELLEEFGKRSGLFCLLNTSLNIMNEPILETAYDAKRFMESSEVDYLIIGDYIISR